MRLLGRLVFSVFSNAVAILAASYFVEGFLLTGSVMDLIVLGVILTFINTFIRPFLKLLLGPLILLTLGLFVIVINALALYILDTVSTALTIQGYFPLLIATLIIGIVNTAIHFSAKLAHK